LFSHKVGVSAFNQIAAKALSMLVDISMDIQNVANRFDDSFSSQI